MCECCNAIQHNQETININIGKQTQLQLKQHLLVTYCMIFSDTPALAFKNIVANGGQRKQTKITTST